MAGRCLNTHFWGAEFFYFFMFMESFIVKKLLFRVCRTYPKRIPALLSNIGWWDEAPVQFREKWRTWKTRWNVTPGPKTNQWPMEKLKVVSTGMHHNPSRPGSIARTIPWSSAPTVLALFHRRYWTKPMLWMYHNGTCLQQCSMHFKINLQKANSSI